MNKDLHAKELNFVMKYWLKTEKVQAAVVCGKSSKVRKMACYVHLEKKLNKENAIEAYRLGILSTIIMLA